MFLGVEWTKRWLSAVFLLLSLFLPWWTMIHPLRSTSMLILSFPWQPYVLVRIYWVPESVGFPFSIVRFYEIPYFCFVSALVVVAGLCGLSSKDRTRTLGGLLGIMGIISYVILIMPKTVVPAFSPVLEEIGNPFFGMGKPARVDIGMVMWFLSFGFYLALAGSLMLLLPLIRTLIERLRKRL